MFCKIMLLSLVSLTATACVTSGNVLADSNNVALGQTANAGGPLIKPLMILEDSRCPINARCVSAGDVRVLVMWVRPDNKSAAGNPKIEVSLTQPAQIADGQLTLIGVTPGREAGSGKALKPSDYRFSFKFDGGL